MPVITFEKLDPTDKKLIELIAEWYFKEWNIPQENTVQKLSNYPTKGIPFQIVLKLDNIPIATGGVYNHVGLLEVEPRFKKYGPWIAVVYTIEEKRKQGYGSLLCEKIELIAKRLGLNKLYLYTFTAQSLYLKLNWKPFERVEYKGHDTVVMEKEL